MKRVSKMAAKDIRARVKTTQKTTRERARQGVQRPEGLCSSNSVAAKMNGNKRRRLECGASHASASK